MKLYLAAPYGHMARMKMERSRFRTAGHIVTSRWIDGDEETMSQADGAQMDIADIAVADALVSYTLPHGTMFTSGGRHVEFGIAIERGIHLFTVGERENVFHHLPQVRVFDSTDELIQHLQEYA